MLQAVIEIYEDINATLILLRCQSSLPFTTNKELWQSDNGDCYHNQLHEFVRSRIFIFHNLNPILIMHMSIIFTRNYYFSADYYGIYSCDLSDETT